MSGPELRSGHVQLGRLRLHHTHGGSGPESLVFIHGLGSSGYIEWRFNLPYFARHQRVFAPDLPGFGRTEKPRARYGIALFTRFVERYLDDQGLSSATLIGASMGGRIALELALRHPARVRRLVLVNALGLGRPQLRFYYPLMAIPKVGETVMRLTRAALHRAPPALIRRASARFIGASGAPPPGADDGYLHDLREMHAARGYPEAYLATVRSLARPSALLGGSDLSRRLAEISIPVQLIWGANDPLFPLAQAVRAQTLIPGSRLAVIQGAGHTPQAERPDEFNRALAGFLEA